MLARYVELLVSILITVGIGTILAVVVAFVVSIVSIDIASSEENSFEAEDSELTIGGSVFLVAWVTVVGGAVSGSGWIVSVVAGFGVSILTAVVVTGLLVSGRFPTVLRARTLRPLFSDMVPIGLIFLVYFAVIGSFWWMFREFLLYDLPQQQRSIVASQVTEYTFWIVFPIFTVVSFIFGLMLIGQVLHALNERVINAVAVIRDDAEKAKLADIEADIENRFFQPVWILIPSGFVLIVMLGYTSLAEDVTIQFSSSLQQYRWPIAVAVESFMIGLTVWSIYLAERVGLREKTIRKLLKRQLSETAISLVIYAALVVLLITAFEPIYDWGVVVARRQIGQGMDYFTPTAQSILAEQPITPVEMREIAFEGPLRRSIDLSAGINFVQFFLSVTFLALTTPIVTSYLYFSRARSFATAFMTYVGFSLIGALVELLWTGELLRLPRLGLNSLLPTAAAVVVAATAQWYSEQLKTLSCRGCDVMVPANNTYCPECGERIGGFPNRE